MSARVVNKETGATVIGPETGHTVKNLGRHPHDRDGYVTVQVKPSFRDGLPYDLASYPAEWVEEADAS